MGYLTKIVASYAGYMFCVVSIYSEVLCIKSLFDAPETFSQMQIVIIYASKRLCTESAKAGQI